MELCDSLLLCPLFEGIDTKDLSAMLSCLGAHTQTARKGESILREGDPAQNVGILLSGQAQVIRTDYYGNRSIMASVSPSDLFGESFACARARKLPVSVVASEECRFMLVDCRRIMAPCQNACGFHSQLIFNLVQIIAEKNLALHQRAMITAKRSTREKLLAYLLLQAKQANSARFSIPFDRQGLADFLEVDRSGLCVELSKLKKEGVLDYYRCDFHLIQPPEI